MDDQTSDIDDDGDKEEEEEEDDEIVAENERVPVGTPVILSDAHDGKVGRVIGNEVRFHYAVDFGDGSYSHDM